MEDSTSPKKLGNCLNKLSKLNTNVSLPGNIPNACTNNVNTESKNKSKFTEHIRAVVHASENRLSSHGEDEELRNPDEQNDCCPFHTQFPGKSLRDPRKREYYSETELENEDFKNRPLNLLSFKKNSIKSSSSENGSYSENSDYDEYSQQFVCLSDKTMERSSAHWVAHRQSAIGSVDEVLMLNCKMCQAEHCNGCRYNFRFAKTRFAGGAQLQHWLSLPDVEHRRRKSILRKLPHPSQTPSETDASEPRRKFTRSQKMTLICIGLVNFSSFLSMSIIAPFFPKEAANKGMREAVSGFVFSVYALVMMIASPLFGKILQHTGPNFMYQCGIFVSGCANMLFGVLDKVEDGNVFTILCFAVRSFEALGAAAFSTASYTIILDMFPDDVGTVFGIMETCVGVGMSLGPAVGGWLYAAGGYELPFFVLGASVLLNMPLSWCMLGNTNDYVPSNCKQTSYRNLLSIPLVMVVSVVVVVASQAQGFIDPTLEPHLRDYNLGTGIVGLLFLLTSAAYAIFSPAVGYLTGNWDVKYPMMLFGLLLMTAALLLLGPSPILPFPGGLLWLNILGIVLLGISFACAFIPTFEAILNAGLDAGLSDDLGTYSIVSGLWNAMCSLGEVTGPSLGGLLSDFLDFPLAATAMAIFSFLSAIMVLLAWLFLGNTCYKKPKEKESDSGISDESIVQDENTLLINKHHIIKYGSSSQPKDYEDPSMSV